MIRGISFTIIQHKNALKKILNCIDVKKYYWYNIKSQSETWKGNDGDILFTESSYTGEEFLQCISQDHFIFFLKLQSYLKKSTYINIVTYKDFESSDCQLLLLINDASFIEIYAKDTNLINRIYNYALQNDFKEIQFITDNNDKRRTMNVL